jgi:predicted nucleic acid-binding protein
MSLVVDASVALAWCFGDEESAVADETLERLRGDQAFAPANWPLEIANALRFAERRGRIDERDIPQATRLLVGLPITVEGTDIQRTLVDVLTLARALELSTYDAAYVDLALRRSLPLATADRYLGHAAVAAGVQVLGASAD